MKVNEIEKIEHVRAQFFDIMVEEGFAVDDSICDECPFIEEEYDLGCSSCPVEFQYESPSCPNTENYAYERNATIRALIDNFIIDLAECTTGLQELFWATREGKSIDGFIFCNKKLQAK